MGDGPPLAYIFPALAFAAALLYYGYGAVDRLGLETRQTEAHVTTKNFAPGSTTYHTNIVAGRAWTQSSKYADSYIVGLDIEGTTTGGLVTPEVYATLNPGDRVRVKFQRTRFSRKILVTDVRR
jgi:hypothetical protein